MSTMFNMVRDINGYNGFGLAFAKDGFQATLTANNAATITVPKNFGTWLAIFSFQPGTVVWVDNNKTAQVPAGATFAATTSELNPSARLVKAGDVLSLITDDTTAEVGVTFYALALA